MDSLVFQNYLELVLYKCVDLANQKCVVRPKIIDVNSNDLVFYPFKIAVNKCSGSCNTINNPFDKICVAKDVKNMNVRVINLLSRVNETRFVEWHHNRVCKWKIGPEKCNSKQRLSEEKCRCECKEGVVKGVCDVGYVFNSSNCECECDKNCNFGEYLDYSECVCRQK